MGSAMPLLKKGGGTNYLLSTEQVMLVFFQIGLEICLRLTLSGIMAKLTLKHASGCSAEKRLLKIVKLSGRHPCSTF